MNHLTLSTPSGSETVGVRDFGETISVARKAGALKRNAFASALLGGSMMLGAVASSLSAASLFWDTRQAFATDCDAMGHVCGPTCGLDARDQSGCDSAACHHVRIKNNPVMHILDGVAGGIEHVLGLDRCTTAGCGASQPCQNVGETTGCGCSSCGGGGSPLPPLMHSSPHRSNASPILAAPTLAPSLGQPRVVLPAAPSTMPGLPTVPLLDTTPRIMSHEGYQMTQPRLIDPPAAPFESSPRSVSPPVEPAPRTSPRSAPRSVMPTTEPEAPTDLDAANDFPATPMSDPEVTDRDAFGDSPPLPGQDLPTMEIPSENDLPAEEPGGSIFDALDSPFGDDSASVRRPYGAIRPTRHQTNLRGQRDYRPIHPSLKPIKPPQQNAIGSGLRRVASPATLRAVSHEEPSYLKPGFEKPTPMPSMDKRVLAPYRASR